MIPLPSKEDLEKGKILHDQIKNHIFRKAPELYLLDEYTSLFDKVFDLFSRYAGGGYNSSTGERTYLYYRWVRDRWLHYKDSRSEDGYFHFNDAAEIFSNPMIAILDYAIHDFNDLKYQLKCHWKKNNINDETSSVTMKIFRTFIEYSEKVLLLIHRIVDGDFITEYSFPSANIHKTEPVVYKMVLNPLYNNDWTLEKYLHRVWYEDKGYVDE